ncbi:condensin-2 complex subunit H2-like [Cucurbita pepo subsp. pepo]|uniref:condensin-2 complex subunit H2-like n=1 Tax=Cucurbita pepo subsp. pepo TaxID=3664 RepID=UPI000C9D710C|nr:condensin-2 complex subunit H2-like [Cucurbita pepo subsp. pepo]
MTSKTGGTGEAAFHMLQPERDLRLNWEVDLAEKLESYLLQICTGEFQSGEDENHNSVNFAEAALLLQDSIQVYSRKVEYLYSLVLRALEFLSEKRQKDPLEGTSIEAEQDGSHEIAEDENDLFWVSEDVPVDTKNTLESTKEDAWLNQTVKPPANLVVLEGDCLDASGDNGELDSYLLASTSDIFQDFVLLDSCDAEAVQDFLNGGHKFGQSHNGGFRGSSTHRGFQSPSRRSGGSMQKSSVGKTQGANVARTPFSNHCFVSDPPSCDNFANENHEFDMDAGNPEPDDSNGSEDDYDPWKPLNPHEPGNLKIKPFRKVKAFKKNYVNSGKHESVAALFPLAKLQGPVSPEFAKLWEEQHQAFETHSESNSALLYEKLRNSLINEDRSCDSPYDVEDDNIDYGFEDAMPDINPPDMDDPCNHYMDESTWLGSEKHDAAAHFDKGETYEPEFPYSHSSQEHFCPSHLDTLLASIAENPTEMATRVSTWKQNIEHNLEEQDKHLPFDIHEYCKAIREKLSGEADKGGVMSFSDVVEGQEKFVVSRSFTAVLQLVNNEDVELEEDEVDGESIVYTSANPFHVRLIHQDKRADKTRHQTSRKRSTSPDKVENGWNINHKSSHIDKTLEESRVMRKLSRQNCKLPVKLGKVGGIKCTPEGKRRRRRARFVEPVD